VHKFERGWIRFILLQNKKYSDYFQNHNAVLHGHARVKLTVIQIKSTQLTMCSQNLKSKTKPFVSLAGRKVQRQKTLEHSELKMHQNRINQDLFWVQKYRTFNKPSGLH